MINRSKDFLYDCKEHYKGSGIYVIDFGTGVKIGMSRNIKSRLKSYRSPWVKPIVRVTCFKTFNYVEVEKLIKDKFSSYTTGNSEEFFTGKNIYEEVLDFIKSNQFYVEDENKKDTSHLFQIPTVEYNPGKYQGLAAAKKLKMI